MFHLVHSFLRTWRVWRNRQQRSTKLASMAIVFTGVLIVAGNTRSSATTEIVRVAGR